MRHSLILVASLGLVALPGCGDDSDGDSTTSTSTASTTTDPGTSSGSGSTTDDPTTSTTSTSTTTDGTSTTTTSGSTGGGSTGGSSGGGSTGGGSTGDTTGGAAQFNPTDTKCDIFCGDYFATCTATQGNDYGDEATCVGQCQSWTAAQWDPREKSLDLAMAGQASTQCVGASMFAQ